MNTPAVLRRDPAVAAAVVVLWLLLALFVVYPMATLLGRVLVDKDGFSLAGIVTVLTDRHQVRAFWNSLALGALVGVGGTVIGFVFAFTAARGRLPRWLLTAIDAAVLLPLVSPPFTTAIAMIFSFGPRGLITYELLGLKGVTVYGLPSTLFSEILTYFPIAYLTLRPLLAAIDSNLEGMALSLGASRWRVFRTVTLPLCVPGLANAFLLLFAASLADFATPLILAGNQFPVLPTQAYLQITGMFDLRGGAALSLVLLVPALAVFLLQRYW
ncbi:MAG TPA: ABC transporter permease subunit, partial [Casimicrobiaceae bacterium]|nr:ABC transporter permease subunit [Casimicrobiaceae bacterium]